MDIKFYLKQGNDKNLYCQISDQNKKMSFSMGLNVDPTLWNSKEKTVDKNDRNFFMLRDFKSYLSYRYSELVKEKKENVLNTLKKEALDLLKNSGIEDTSRHIFNTKGSKCGLLLYDDYLLAFEKYTGFKKEDYKVEILHYLVHFHTAGETYEMDTYEGKIAYLKDLIENRAYFDIVTLSNSDVWSEIYEVIPKHKFVVEMQKEIDYCIKENFKRTGIFSMINESIEEKKNNLRKNFQLFIDHYEEGNVIDLAWEIDEDVLYPMAVIAMTNIYDLDACCEEYCELEFNDDDEGWKVIFLNDELEDMGKDESLAFYIRPYR